MENRKSNIINILPALRMIASDESLKIIRYKYNKINSSEIEKIYCDKNIDKEIIKFCKNNFIQIKSNNVINELIEKYNNFRKSNSSPFFIIHIENIGLIGIGKEINLVRTGLDLYEKIFTSRLKDSEFNYFQDFINTVKVGSSHLLQGKVANKIAVVTGGAQGFGEGIARDLYKENAQLVIADLNQDRGKALADELNSKDNKERVKFYKTDVSDADSVKKLIEFTVMQFGGIDLMISNAGILRAGALDEMDVKTFELMTKINYNGYFNCAKYASNIMKLQWQYNKNHFTDIIQINSKSGLKGSNKNFAYAGAKFGGIGLTQSFAMELMPYNIKVNSICPGNYFDGPLWSDPEKGLFFQYLNTGKVPGAKTIEDVKRYYENLVPAKRGCKIEDLMKAIYYAIDQQYETGQAIPVTGGQIMLN